MNIVDSSAWLSFFADEKNAPVFSPIIQATRQLLVPSITITEVFKTVQRQRDEESALIVIAHMLEGKVIPLNTELAIDAASYGVTYHLPLADSIIFATAQKYNATLWTQDHDFQGLPNVNYYPKLKP